MSKNSEQKIILNQVIYENESQKEKEEDNEIIIELKIYNEKQDNNICILCDQIQLNINNERNTNYYKKNNINPPIEFNYFNEQIQNYF